MRSLVDEGFAVVGGRTQAGFMPWTIPVVDGLDGREGWLQLTDAGRVAARDVPVGVVGDLPDGSVPQWDWPLAQAAARVLDVDRFDDESVWEWFCLLELTRRGTVLARAIEGQA